MNQQGSRKEWMAMKSVSHQSGGCGGSGRNREPQGEETVVPTRLDPRTPRAITLCSIAIECLMKDRNGAPIEGRVDQGRVGAGVCTKRRASSPIG